MSGDLALIRNGLVTNLSSLSGLTVRLKFGLITPPMALVGLPSKIIYDEDLDGSATYTIPLKFFMPNTEAGSDLLQSYMNESGDSVKRAAESDPTLGGACDSARVTEMEMAAPEFENEKASYLTADWVVEVFA